MKPSSVRNLERVLLLAALSLLFPATTSAENSAFVQAETGVSYLSEWSVGRATPGTVAYSIHGGYRWETFDLGLMIEHNLWLSDNIGDGSFNDSVINVALEGGINYFDDRVSSGLGLGTSTMLFDTDVTRGAGHTGLFVEVRPAGFRFPLGEEWQVEIDPLNFMVMAPVLDSVPLFHSAYRTTLAIERVF